MSNFQFSPDPPDSSDSIDPMNPPSIEPVDPLPSINPTGIESVGDIADSIQIPQITPEGDIDSSSRISSDIATGHEQGHDPNER